MAPLLAKITMAQEAAPLSEKAAWKGPTLQKGRAGKEDNHSLRRTGQGTASASDIKSVLLRMAHDNTAHYLGAQRTVWQLQR